MERGKFITFEGCEGVGKSTQIKLLKNYLDKTAQEYISLREPGGNHISEAIREIILNVENKDMSDKCEAFLYSSARAQLMDTVIIPALNEGKLVLCDRFIDSTIAYQGYARGLGIDYVRALNELVCGDYMPNITIFLDYSPNDAFKRKGGADSNDRIEQESNRFHEMVYEGYKIVAEMYKDRIVSISPTGSKYDTNSGIIHILKARGIIR